MQRGRSTPLVQKVKRTFTDVYMSALTQSSVNGITQLNWNLEPFEIVEKHQPSFSGVEDEALFFLYEFFG